MIQGWRGREKELSNLEEEAKTISEAEKSVNPRKEGKNLGE